MSTTNISTQTLIDARRLGRVQELATRSITKLSSGSRIVSPADDPVGVGASQKLGAQGRRIQSALTNIQNATSYLQSSDGFLNSMSTVLNRMSELGVLATDPTKNAGDMALYQTEFKALQDQLRSTIGGTTAQIGGVTDITQPGGTFTGLVLFGPNPGGLTIATGDSPDQTVTISEANLRIGAMLAPIRQDASGNYTLQLTDPTVVSQLTSALQQIGDARSNVGAVSHRFEMVASAMTTQGQNINSAVSSIQDVDVATESTRLSKLQILTQTATAMVSQANQAPKSVLQFLQALEGTAISGP